MNKRIVTSYEAPDLDGVSSMYAYAEYLNKIGIPSDYYIKGEPKKEVGIVCDLFQIKLKGEKAINKEQEVVLLDINNLEEVFNFLNPDNIIEIIDHHPRSKSCEQCKNAKVQIETLGAVATLIAEKFKENNIPISRESAILLYYGIISNSINLKASITDKKDVDMANWLEERYDEITKERIEEIFILKSRVEDSELRQEMEAEVAFDFKGKRMTIAQLEIANIEEFLREKEEKIIKVLKQVKQEHNIDYIFMNCVDILNGFNIVLAIDEETQILLEKELGYSFERDRCKFDKLIQRKDLFKAIKEKLNKDMDR